MGDESEREPQTDSPWPMVVALGLALSEVGVFIGFRSVAVAGLLMFVGAVAGILTESGYISRPGRAVTLMALALIIIGVALVTQHGTGTPVRGQSITIAGVLSLCGALAWIAFVWSLTRRDSPHSASSETTSD